MLANKGKAVAAYATKICTVLITTFMLGACTPQMDEAWRRMGNDFEQFDYSRLADFFGWQEVKNNMSPEMADSLEIDQTYHNLTKDCEPERRISETEGIEDHVAVEHCRYYSNYPAAQPQRMRGR